MERSWNIHKLWWKEVHSAWKHIQVKWLKAYVGSYQPYAKISKRSKMYKQKLSSGWGTREVEEWNRKWLPPFSLCLLHIYSGHVYMKAYIRLIVCPGLSVCTLCKVFLCLYSVSMFCVIVQHQMLESLSTNVTQIKFCSLYETFPSVPLSSISTVCQPTRAAAFSILEEKGLTVCWGCVHSRQLRVVCFHREKHSSHFKKPN